MIVRWFSLFVLVALGWFSLQAQSKIDRYLPTSWPDHIILNLTENSNERVVTWRTDTSSQPQQVQWLISDGSSNLVEKSRTETANSEVLQTGEILAKYNYFQFEKLQAGLSYAYRVGSDACWSEWFQFTVPDNDNIFSFLYFGDAQNDMRDLWSRCLRKAVDLTEETDFMLHAGDMVDFSSNNWEWGEWFYGGGWMFASTPQVLVLGNHEYVQKQKILNEYWNASFTLPKNGPKGLEERAYYIDYENTRLIVLDSRDMLLDEANAQRQAEWLEPLLKNNPKQWTIVSHHHPIYSARSNRGDYDIRAVLQPLYDQYKVDLVLQGHHHSFARGRKESEVGEQVHSGPVYFVSNSGPKMYDTNFAPWMERVGTDVQLFHQVNIENATIEVLTYLVNGELYDRIRIQKLPNGDKSFEEIKVEGVTERLDFSHASYGADIDQSEESRTEFKKKAEEYLERRGGEK